MDNVEVNISKNLLLCILYSMTSDCVKRTESAMFLQDLSPEHKELLATLMLAFTDEVKHIVEDINTKESDEQIAGQSFNDYLHNLIKGKKVE